MRRVADRLTVSDGRADLPRLPNPLTQSIAQNRAAGMSRNGLSLEDLVRDEVRPLIKEWLDRHLPAVVEQWLQAELERLIADELN